MLRTMGSSLSPPLPTRGICGFREKPAFGRDLNLPPAVNNEDPSDFGALQMTAPLVVPRPLGRQTVDEHSAHVFPKEIRGGLGG